MTNPKYIFNTPYAVWMRSKKHAWWIGILLVFIGMVVAMFFVELDKKMHNEWVSQKPAYFVEDEFRNINSKSLLQVLLYKIGMENTFIDRAIDRSKQKSYESAIAKIPTEDGERYFFLYDLNVNKFFKKEIDPKEFKVFYEAFKGLSESKTIKNDYYNSVRKLSIMNRIFKELMNISANNKNLFSDEQINFLIDESIKTLQITDIDFLILKSNQHKDSNLSKARVGAPLIIEYLSYVYKYTEDQIKVTAPAGCNYSAAQRYKEITDLALKIINKLDSLNMSGEDLAEILPLKNEIEKNSKNDHLLDHCSYKTLQ